MKESAFWDEAYEHHNWKERRQQDLATPVQLAQVTKLCRQLRLGVLNLSTQRWFGSAWAWASPAQEEAH